ncbi:MAG: sodium-dependent transporter [Ruminococcaceae bacterium]|nr:sodium-dependent transporter [Oscillospiraceae bacterium]
MEQKRSNFSGKLGFVLATAGSAVGLGNIWRFPYLAAKHGGGMFLLTYLILVLTFGFTLACTEILIGRKTGQSAVKAFNTLNKKWSFVGWLAAIVPIIILPYYSVIGGWIFKYLFAFASGQATATAGDGYFTGFIDKIYEPIGWFLLFIGITALIVLFGVEKGIEKASKIMMPVLVVLTLFIAIYSACMPGALKGVLYYITPDFSHFSVTTVLAALGQLFYSMSLAMGIMITYGSYMKKDFNVVSSVHQVEIFDTGIAFLAGLMIVPAVFSFSGGSEDALSKGPSLMFITLPKVFQSMPGGTIIGIIFFLMVLFAALTSSISLMETVVSVIQDKFKLNRKVTCLIVFTGSVILGIPSSLGNGVWESIKIFGFAFLDFFDFISNSVLMPIVALLTCVFVGYIIKPKTLIEEAEISAEFKGKKFFSVVIRYIAPICIILILGFSVLEAFGIIKV